MAPLLTVAIYSLSPKQIKVLCRAATAFFQRDRAKLAALFDFFLTLFFIRSSALNNLQISSIFLNGLAHVQHHYLLSSKFISASNPDWYVDSKKDPLLDCLKIYDELFGVLLEKKQKLAVITALSQEPYTNSLIYWRFVDHNHTLRQILNLEFTCTPKMSRDFALEFKSEEDCLQALEKLKKCEVISKDYNDKAFGFFDKNGNSIFCSFLFSGSSDEAFLKFDDQTIDLHGAITFVAIKNSGHCGEGYATFLPKDKKSKTTVIPIWELNDKVLNFIEMP